MSDSQSVLSESTEVAPSGTPLIQVKGLSKTYEKKGALPVKALDEVDLTVQAGEFTAIAGPSGSGKTTLLNCIGTLDVPTSGEVYFGGKPTAAMNRNQRATFRLQNMGFIFQAYNLIPVLTAEENAEFILLLQGVSAAERKERVQNDLEALGIERAMLKRRPNELSGGQQQRIAIARALVARPKLILADEPTANLDSTTGARLLDTMRIMNKQTGITFLFSTHDPMVMERARRLITLRDGKILEDRTK